MRIFLLLFTITALASMSCKAADDELIDDEFEGIEFQHILSSTRLKTPHMDAPASISVITAEDIERYRYRSVPEALKSIPGFIVGQSHSSYDQYVVSYHGGNSNVPRRTNVIVDGVSHLQSGFSRVHWEELPVVMSEIESIEVIRGPAASLYGSNSFTSVVNIMTKKPKQTLGKLGSQGISINGRLGQPGVRDASLSYTSNYQDLYYRFTINHVHDHGFDITSTGTKRHDSTWINHLDFYGSYDLSNTSELEFSLGHTKQRQQEQFIVSFQTTFPDYVHESVRGSIKFTNEISSKHNLQISSYFRLFEQEQSYNANVPTYLTSPELEQLSIIDSNYANAIAAGINPISSGGTLEADKQAAIALAQIASIGSLALFPINLDVPQNFNDNQYQIEIQDTYAYSDQLRILTGASVTYVDTRSFQWLIDGERSLTTYRAFANAEWKFSDNIIINGGTMYEYDKQSGSTISPRLALSYRINESHSLRYVLSRASRTPDIFEQFADWRLIGQNFSANPFGVERDFLTFYARAISPGGLASEEIVSNELGYHFMAAQTRTEIDIRLFDEDMTSLISEKLELRNFKPTNTGYAKKRGVDVQVKTHLTPLLNIAVSYSYVDIDSVLLEKTLTANHVGSLALSYDFAPDYRLSLLYYGFSRLLASSPSSNPGVTTATDPVESIDITLQWTGDTVTFDDIDLYLQTRIRNGNQEIQQDNIYKDRTKTVVGFSVNF